MLLPERVAEKNDVRTAGSIVIGCECAAEERLNAERWKKIRCNPNPLEIFRIAPTGEGEACKGLGREVGETLLLVAPGGEARPGNIGLIEPAFGERAPDADQLLRFRIGQRAEEEGIDGGKEHGVGADAEGESNHSQNGEARLLEQLSKGVTKIIHRCRS